LRLWYRSRVWAKSQGPRDIFVDAIANSKLSILVSPTRKHLPVYEQGLERVTCAYILLELSRLACPHDTHVGKLEVSRHFNTNFATGLKIGFQGAHDATFPKLMPHFFFPSDAHVNLIESCVICVTWERLFREGMSWSVGETNCAPTEANNVHIASHVARPSNPICCLLSAAALETKLLVILFFFLPLAHYASGAADFRCSTSPAWVPTTNFRFPLLCHSWRR
jgi:hypothetical protein